MIFHRCALVVFLLLHHSCLTSANNGRMVKAGMLAKAALPYALKLCPSVWNKKKKTKVVETIRNFMKPAHTASDPHRNSYGADYIPTEEEIRAKSMEMCKNIGFALPDENAGYSFESENFEKSTEPEKFSERESLLETQVSTNPRNHGVSETGPYLLFFFGTAVGMLIVSIYFHSKGNSSSQIHAPKSLRRPEL